MKTEYVTFFFLVILSVFIVACDNAELSEENIEAEANLIEWNGHFYGITPQKDYWDNAEAYAVSQGGYLVTIDNAAENIFIQNTFLTGNNVNEKLWIGLTCHRPLNYLDKSSWSWVDGSTVTYSNWRAGQPDKGFDSDRYVAINYQGGSNNQWDNFPNKSNYMFRGIYEVNPDT